MPARLPVYLEVAPKRTFASAVDWPGWSRSGRTAEEALDALAAAGPRYARALGNLASGLEPTADGRGFEIIEHVEGGSGTEFGVPSRSPDGDDRPVEPAEHERLAGILRAAWAAFDSAAVAAQGHTLTTGPRGGGRDLAKMTAHVIDADSSYLQEIGGKYKAPRGASEAENRDAIRDLIVETLAARVRGEPPPPSKRIRPLWTPRYLVRRSAWHALDHAWELEDRVV
jgi:hypothetical protein